MNEQKSKHKVFLELFVLSFAAMWFELLIIRWMASDIRAFTVFKTFPLVTCFVGLGVGFAMGSDRLFRLNGLALLQSVAVIKILEFCGLSGWVFPSISVFAWEWVDRLKGAHLAVYVLCSIILLILVLAGPFVFMASLGARLGVLFNQLAALEAYCVNIGGSIAGSLAFACLSFLGAPPWLLLIPAAMVIMLYLQRLDKNVFASVLPIAAAIVLAAVGDIRAGAYGTYWSPYHRLDVVPLSAQVTQNKAKDNGSLGIIIGANRNFYQYAMDLSDATVMRPGLPADTAKLLKDNAIQYNLPYKLKGGQDVLILGAGAGNDIAAALRNGAKHVDAIDIDPAIIRLGQLYHPEHPYSSDKVAIFCDDARDFLHHCKKTYDLVIFAGLDSHTVTGQGASVRLDNYVYTLESIRLALRLVRGDGLLVLSFCKSQPWLSSRLFCTLRQAAGYDPIVMTDSTKPRLQWEIFLAGPLVEKHLLKIPQNLEHFAVESPPNTKVPCGRILTDDWPFVYVTPVLVDGPYLLVVFCVLALSTFAARRSLFKPFDPKLWQMFFLGAAFLLLELQSIARLSLLYGSTWLTSSVVINGVLIGILIANLIVMGKGAALANRQSWLYALLGLALLLSYALPIDNILGSATIPFFGTCLVTVVTFLPMFCAGMVFATAFRRLPKPAEALAFNLFGAVIGAMLEYLANYLGINALALVALFLYMSSYLCFKLIPIATPLP